MTSGGEVCEILATEREGHVVDRWRTEDGGTEVGTDRMPKKLLRPLVFNPIYHIHYPWIEI